MAILCSALLSLSSVFGLSVLCCRPQGETVSNRVALINPDRSRTKSRVNVGLVDWPEARLQMTISVPQCVGCVNR